jgi:ABC-type phosphate/phosphonate transport system substrate-binding protein
MMLGRVSFCRRRVDASGGRVQSQRSASMKTRKFEHQDRNRSGCRDSAHCQLALVFLLWFSTAVVHCQTPTLERFRVGFASSMFTEVNEDDAKAAMKVWGQTVAKERGIPTDPDTEILHGQAEILRSLRNKEVDAVGMTTTEYNAVFREVPLSPLFVKDVGGRFTDEYVLLVRKDGGVDTLADLRGHRLNYHQSPRLSLARIWLDTLLAEQGLKPTSDFAGHVTFEVKLSKAVLPVFFRQSDACVVARGEFATMNELNPQLGVQLRVLASSPELVPVVLAFRADYQPTFRQELFAGLRDLHQTPAGQQVLTIFQCERIEERPVSCVSNAVALIGRHAALAESNPRPASFPAGEAAKISGGPNP